MKQNKTKNFVKRNKRTLIGIFLSAVFLIGTVFALLTATDSKKNVFTVGNVSIKLLEDFDTNNNGKIDDNETYDETKKQPPTVENVVPGEVVLKQPYVENAGSNNAQVFIAVGMPVATKSEVYTGDGSTDIDEVDVTVKAFAIQEVKGSTVSSQQMFESYLKDTNIETILGKKDTSEDRIELFSFVELNTEKWENIKIKSSYDEDATNVTESDVYTSKDGHNYYIFMYNSGLDSNNNISALLEKGTTSAKLCKGVKLTEELGKKIPETFTVNFYAQIDNLSVDPTEGISLSDCELVDSCVGKGTITLDSLPTNSQCFQPGCSFDYVQANLVNNTLYVNEDSSKNTVAFSGITFTSSDATNNEINLLGVNKDISNGATEAGYLTYYLQDGYAILNGANPTDTNYPSSPTTVSIPSYLNIEVENYHSKVLNGYVVNSGDLFGKNQDVCAYDEIKGTFGFAQSEAYIAQTSFGQCSKTVSGGKIIYQIPVTQVSVCGSTLSGSTATSNRYNALLSVAKTLVVPEEVTDLSYMGDNSDRTSFSVLENINIPYSCQSLGFVYNKAADDYYKLIARGGSGTPSGLFNNPNLTNVSLPNTIKRIGPTCFANTNLTSITLPESVKDICSHAFSLSTQTTYAQITVPSSVENIVDNAFCGVNTVNFKGINWLLIKDSWNTYEKLGCSNVSFDCTVDDFKNSNTYETLAFAGAFYHLNTITFTDASPVPTDLISSYVKDDVLYINDTIIATNNSAKNITIKDGITTINQYAFHNNNNIESITIPNSVTSIETAAFQSCDNLTTVNLSNNITNIGEKAFYGCFGLTSITIPNSVTSIGYCAFKSCKNLTSITIPNSVTSIGGCAFESCSSLQTVIMPNSVTTMGERVFEFCTSLTSATLSSNLTSISSYTFCGCSSLSNVNIPNNVTSINQNAFSECTSLTSITIPNTVTSIDAWAFSNCTSIANLAIPNSVTHIHSLAFNNVQHISYTGSATGAPWGAQSIN